MHLEIKKDNKYIDFEATQTSFEDPLLQKPILKRLASPFAKDVNFDAVGTIKTYEGGKFNIVPEEMTPLKMKSKTLGE